MGVTMATSAVSGSPAPFGFAASLPRLAQPGYLATDPFSAYLLSLTDPATQALDALTRSVAAPAAAAIASRTAASPVLTALLASAASAGVAAVPANSPALPAPVVPANPGPAAASAALPLVQTEATEDAGTEPDALAGDAAAARDAAASSAQSSLNADRVADAIAAANAAAVASLAAIAALYASNAASTVTGNSQSLATDATAKYMGAGAMGQPATDLSAYQVIQNAIPAVSGVLAASAMAANTSSNSSAQSFVQTAVRPPARIQVRPFAESSGLDLLS
jgi:hypothetical protein